MSLTTNASQRRIDHLANTLVRSLRDQIPGSSFAGRGTMITAELLNQVTDIIRKNLFLLAGSTFMTAGLLTLLPTLVVIAVNTLGFTAGGVLQGSIAALIQSVIFGGQTAGWFSVLQGIGATAAISPPAVIGIGAALAVAGAGIYYLQVTKSPRQQEVLDFFDRAYNGIWSKESPELVSPASINDDLS